jgi:hypothetical protein
VRTWFKSPPQKQSSVLESQRQSVLLLLYEAKSRKYMPGKVIRFQPVYGIACNGKVPAIVLNESWQHLIGEF